MKMPKVGITCYASQGGSGVVATELGLHLSRRGCEVHFISSELPFRLRKYHENIFYHPVEMPHYPVFQHSPYTLSLATAMSEVAERCELDILHVHYAIPHAASAYLAQKMCGRDSLKVVTTLHGTDITLVGQEPSFFPITRFLIEQSDAVTAVSGFLKQETIKVFGTGENIEVIPNFVDARVFKTLEDNPLRERFAPGGEKLLAHASNFRKVKNLEAVVDVFAKVNEVLPWAMSASRWPRPGWTKKSIFLGTSTAWRRSFRWLIYYCCPPSTNPSAWWHWKPWPAVWSPSPRTRVGPGNSSRTA